MIWAFCIFVGAAIASMVLLLRLGNQGTAEQEMSTSLAVAGLILVSFLSGLVWIAMMVIKVSSL